jgi:ribosomal protein S18 acetylase RimI-like enzyme
MTIKNLSNISFNELLDCFLAAFENYYVKMPSDRNYYKNRWKAANVNYQLSYGLFDKGKLVGFIIHAIDKRNGILTAFNTGTGVIPEYRGEKIVKSIYTYALKDLAQHGIQKSTLEVITKNNIAIKAYEGVGFKISKKFKCYGGEIKIVNYEQFEMEKLGLKNIDWNTLPNQQYYSWDFQKETLLKGNNTFFQVLNNKKPESFFILNTDTNYIAQCDVLNKSNNGWNRLFNAINKQVSGNIKIINVDERLKDKLNYINSIGLEHLIDQYEMELIIKS